MKTETITITLEKCFIHEAVEEAMKKKTVSAACILLVSALGLLNEPITEDDKAWARKIVGLFTQEVRQ
jgi:hypothetical protein